jgi:acetaldehyde dehydrogenase
MPPAPLKVAILGTGNIGTDLLLKLLARPGNLVPALFAGIDPASPGLARARALGVPVSDRGVEAVLADPSLRLVFDATSAPAHRRHTPALAAAGRVVVDLTPAALGPGVVPVVNLAAHAGAANVSLVTCGGQATIPMVYAVSRVTRLAYAEIVATVSSAPRPDPARNNIDEFTHDHREGRRGDRRRHSRQGDHHPQPRRTAADDARHDLLLARARRRRGEDRDLHPADGRRGADLRPGLPPARRTAVRHHGPDGTRGVATFIEVQGAGDFLPPYAGNLDIMTAAAWRRSATRSRRHLARRRRDPT